jgi:hypothetical protein
MHEKMQRGRAITVSTDIFPDVLQSSSHLCTTNFHLVATRPMSIIRQRFARGVCDDLPSC